MQKIKGVAAYELGGLVMIHQDVLTGGEVTERGLILTLAQAAELREQLGRALENAPTPDRRLREETEMSTFLMYDELSPRPADKAAEKALDEMPNDPLGRVIVRLREDEVTKARGSERWYATTDLRTGLSVEIRRADCGAGCKCAAEVRLA